MALVVSAFVVLGVAPHSFAADGSAEVRAMLAEINAVRAQFGLRAVGVDGRLMQAAQAYTQELAAEGRLSHGDFAGRMAALGPDTAMSPRTSPPASPAPRRWCRRG